MVAYFLRFFLLHVLLLTCVHSFHVSTTSTRTNEQRSFRLSSIRNNDSSERAQSFSKIIKQNNKLAGRPIEKSNGITSSTYPVSRSDFLSKIVAATSAVIAVTTLPSDPVSAFVGGVGGLGKTKPETGVDLLGSTPIQNSQGIISAEIQVNQAPVRISFQAPWPLLGTTGGLEARGLQYPESAFVQVVSGVSKLPTNGKDFRPILLQSVLAQQGKFGAYGTPMDVRVRATEDPSVYSVKFMTLTPGEIETERQVLIKAVEVRGAGSGTGSLVLLVVGTTSLRFKKQKDLLQQVVDSFEAVPAPATKLR
jgi:hypothetical protein